LGVGEKKNYEAREGTSNEMIQTRAGPRIRLTEKAEKTVCRSRGSKKLQGGAKTGGRRKIGLKPESTTIDRAGARDPGWGPRQTRDTGRQHKGGKKAIPSGSAFQT